MKKSVVLGFLLGLMVMGSACTTAATKLNDESEEDARARRELRMLHMGKHAF